MPAKKTSRRAPRAKKSAAYDMSPMSLLQTPDEPKPEPMPGPQTMACTNCRHLPFGARRLTAMLAAITLVLSSYTLIGMAERDPQAFGWTASLSSALQQLASR